MAKKGKSIRQQANEVRRRQQAVLTRKIPDMAERALSAVGPVVGNKALEYTPVEYGGAGGLIGNQYREVTKTATGWRLAISYTSGYAAPLHNRTDWNPRPPSQKPGPAWNPNATHHFLSKAGEETKALQTQIIKGNLKL